MKICVYAISKNEEKFVKRWLESMSEADEIYVLDTNSNDKTRTLLRQGGAKVRKKIIDPWRFDVARNESLKLVPEDTDICVCTDLDEVFKPGWRKKLEQIWDSKTTRLSYNYNWSLDENNNPLVSFYIEKIHSRKNYQWVHPVHEVLECTNIEVKKITDDITLNHYPDATKSRKQYLPLLELSVKEDPNNDRNMHYLGREYMYHERWNEAIDTLIKHLNLPTATWIDERCASMRFISRCYQRLNRYDEAKMWLDKAILEAPHLRDPFMERAFLEYYLNNWKNVESYCLKALEIKKPPKTYINEIFSSDSTVYDLLSISYYNQDKIDKAISYIKKAIEINPSERIIKNLKIMQEKKS